MTRLTEGDGLGRWQGRDDGNNHSFYTSCTAEGEEEGEPLRLLHYFSTPQKIIFQNPQMQQLQKKGFEGWITSCLLLFFLLSLHPTNP